MSFRDFSDFNAAESELVLDKAAEPLAGVIGCAASARALADSLPQRYRRAYTNVQVLVVDHETGDVTDKTTPERVSAVEELITKARAGLQFLKDKIEYYSSIFATSYQGKLTLQNGGGRFVMTELGGALFNLDMENGELEDVFWADRGDRNVSMWDSDPATWTYLLTHLPNREVLGDNQTVLFKAKCQTVQFDGATYDVCLFKSPSNSRLCLTIQYKTGWHLYEKVNNQWTRVGESSAADWVTAMSEFGFTGLTERKPAVRFAINQQASTSDDQSYTVTFDASKFSSQLIYDLTKLDNVINSLPD